MEYSFSARWSQIHSGRIRAPRSSGPSSTRRNAPLEPISQPSPFCDPASLQAINGWVSCATHGKIPTILNQLNPSQVLILIDALYFHGEWSSPFYKGETYRQTFHAITASRRVPFMHDTTYFPYLSTGNFQAVSLPFSRGRYSMVVVLPRPATKLSQVEGDLSETSWRDWMANLKGTEVKLSLPRFTIQNGFDLTGTLGALGMRPALEGGAKSILFFGRIVDPTS
jgi:serine protease inhibitor